MVNLSDLYNDFKALVAQYSYTKAETDTLLSNKSASTHTHGNLTNDGKIGNSSGKVITTTTDGAVQASTSIDTDQVTDDAAYTNLGTSANSTQSQINSAINTTLGDIHTLIYGTGE